MCAQFLLRTSLNVLLNRLASLITGDMPHQLGPERVLPFRPGLVIHRKGDITIASTMQYSLVPSWSKQARPPFATYNARLDTIETKATWKKPFSRQHCLIPMTHFIEPIYRESYAGNMVQFYSPTDEMLFAVGIYDVWEGPERSDPLNSFAIITDQPSPFVQSIGHDRQPLFLTQNDRAGWLAMEGAPLSEQKEFLHQHRYDPSLSVAIDRAMKAGWERRVPKK